MTKGLGCLRPWEVMEITKMGIIVMFWEHRCDLIWTSLSILSSWERQNGPYRLSKVNGLPSQEFIAVLTELNHKKLHRRSPGLNTGPSLLNLLHLWYLEQWSFLNFNIKNLETSRSSHNKARFWEAYMLTLPKTSSSGTTFHRGCKPKCTLGRWLTICQNATAGSFLLTSILL